MASESGVIGGIAERYATALYELADESKSLDAVADEVGGLARLIAEHDDLAKLVRSPLISRRDKKAAMAAVLEEAGVLELVRRFVAVVAANGRLFALGPIIDAFLAELARRRGEVLARVTSARPLNDGQRSAVMDVLRRMGGDKVTMDV
ncbi:MAG: ATP synthase F1 subunit delta, partial [Alphaproteobacteria bacterium]|nr:ATP synthase F1 subunit delta [Alphaproteobacteria bacterium]